MNTYKKYCPNVFIAQCEYEHAKNDVITIETKYGNEHECEVHNLLYQKDDYYYYSITRTDGFNAQQRAANKAEKLQMWAQNAYKRSAAYYEASNEGRDFLSLGEPIKVGHHSENRHRNLIKRNWDRMGKSVAEADKAKDYLNRVAYWEAKAKDINLSMPESLEYYEFTLFAAQQKHKELKDDATKRRHSYSLTYAKKEVNELTKKLKIAIKLWGTKEQIQQLAREDEAKEKGKVIKNSKVEAHISNCGGFFAFNNDQFKEGYASILELRHVEQGDKVKHIHHGLYIPSKNVDLYLNGL